jgi:hypothetical protein
MLDCMEDLKEYGKRGPLFTNLMPKSFVPYGQTCSLWVIAVVWVVLDGTSIAMPHPAHVHN